MQQIPAVYKELFDRFSAGPGVLRAAMAGVSQGVVSQRAPGQDWSIRDHVVHLADAELVRAVRVRFIIAEEVPLLPAWDEGEWKRRLQYLWRDVDGAIAQFELTRWSTAELVAYAGKAAWERQGRSGEELVSVRDLVERGVGHIDDHVAQIAEARAALGGA
ncbi:MAG: DinB family protein [Dehalococcoidia bacterium]|nr:DinB family protein [Dehalococcoidia bacterium]